jgi:hypothetical protein
MGKDKHHKGKKDGFDFGHLSSQKFAGLVFCVFLLFTAGFFLPLAAFGNLVMGVTGLYTAFVGGRAYSDGQALKFGGTIATTDSQTSVVTPLPKLPVHAPAVHAPEVRPEDQEID